jgi:hypothetical protein
MDVDKRAIITGNWCHMLNLIHKESKKGRGSLAFLSVENYEEWFLQKGSSVCNILHISIMS